MYFGGFDAIVIRLKKNLNSNYQGFKWIFKVNNPKLLELTSSVRFNRVQTVSEMCRSNYNCNVFDKQIVTKRGDTVCIAPFIF